MNLKTARLAHVGAKVNSLRKQLVAKLGKANATRLVKPVLKQRITRRKPRMHLSLSRKPILAWRLDELPVESPLSEDVESELFRLHSGAPSEHSVESANSSLQSDETAIADGDLDDKESPSHYSSSQTSELLDDAANTLWFEHDVVYVPPAFTPAEKELYTVRLVAIDHAPDDALPLESACIA